MIETRIIILGETISTGCYLLRIQLLQAQKIQFGRYNQSGAHFLPKGDYIYIGSALGNKGASSLGYRLMRHLTRCSGDTPHAIRGECATQLYNAGIQAKVPRNKKCHWHIDYLLEIPQAQVIGIIILRSQADYEKQIAAAFANLPETSTPVPGLGASDHPGNTHLFHITAGADWWSRLPQFILDAAIAGDGLAKI